MNCYCRSCFRLGQPFVAQTEDEASKSSTLKDLRQQFAPGQPVIHAAGVIKQALCREADAEIPPKERTVNFRLVTCPECAKILTEMGK